MKPDRYCRRLVQWDEKCPGTVGAARGMPSTDETGAEMQNATCSVEGCDQPAHRRWLCGSHWLKFRKSPEWTPLPVLTSEQRFWAKVQKTETCWLWTARRDSRGYGTFSVGGKNTRPHRYVYELLVGPIPDGLVIDHLCRVRHCCNPEHLEPVTSEDNVSRGIARNARKTHCLRGHPFSGENLIINKDGTRSCRVCGRARRRAWEARQ